MLQLNTDILLIHLHSSQNELTSKKI